MRWWKYINDKQKEHNSMMSGCGTLMMICCDVYCIYNRQRPLTLRMCKAMTVIPIPKWAVPNGCSDKEGHKQIHL